MMRVKYDGRYGAVVPDNAALEFATTAVRAGVNVTIGSDILIDAIRLAMVNENVPHDAVVFEFNGELIHIDALYNLESWPTGFGDADQVILRELRERACR